MWRHSLPPIFNTSVHILINGSLQTPKCNEIHPEEVSIFQRNVNNLLLTLRTLEGQLDFRSRRGRTESQRDRKTETYREKDRDRQKEGRNFLIM